MKNFAIAIAHYLFLKLIVYQELTEHGKINL